MRLKAKSIGILLGVLYGVGFWIFFATLLSDKSVSGLVTISFLFIVPLAIGYIRIHFEFRQNPEISYKRMAVVAWQPVFIGVLTLLATLQEGVICVVLAMPALMLLSSIGGLLAGDINRMRRKHRNSTLLSVAALPLVLGPLEINYLHLSQTYQVENQIVIDTTPEVVWNQLGSVVTIKDGELPLSFTALIGVPRPLEARMDASGVGAVRTSVWEKGVVFNEVITAWEPKQRMAYDFDIDPDKIPDKALDPHVKLGGEYFSPLHGEYRITRNDNGETVLHLQTTLVDNTHFGWYSRLWGEIIFRDFHRSLLVLMKNRAEAAG